MNDDAARALATRVHPRLTVRAPKSATSRPQTSNGCTNASGPKARASACSPKEKKSEVIPSNQTGRCISVTSSRHDSALSWGTTRAALCWSTAPTEKHEPAAMAASTAIITR